MFSPLDLLSLSIIISITIVCGFVIFKKDNFGSLLHFKLFIFSTLFWLISNFLLKVIDNQEYILFSLRFTFAIAAFMLCELLLFSLNFPKKLLIKSDFNIIAYFVAGIIVVLSFLPYLVHDFTKQNEMVLAIYGSGFFIFASYALLMLAGIVIALVIQYKVSSGLTRQQTKLLSIGIFLSIIFISAGDLIIPIISNSNVTANFGPFGIVFFILFSVYAITKHHLFEIGVMFSEIWALILLITIITWLFSHFNTTNFFGFLFILSVCVLFVRSVLSEAKNKEQIEKQNIHLEKDKIELKELDRMKDEFLQMATHELNTPITVIKGKLDMAIREDLCKLTPEQRKFLEPVLNDTLRLSTLSDDILNVARIDQHRLKINLSETAISELIAQIVSGFELKAKERGNSLLYIKPIKLLPKIKIDQVKIGEVITNLINNANKFTENGKITVTSKLTDDNIIISIADTGVGIEKEDQEHLFEKFYQASRFDPDNPQEQQGTGLGLYISKNIISLHGGKIWLDSEKGRGSTFYFSLPLKITNIHSKLKEGDE